MQLINDWSSLTHVRIFSLGDYARVIPSSRLKEIQSKCSTKRETANKCASYYVHCHPQSAWTHLASRLYTRGEFAAVEELKPFLPLRGKCKVRELHIIHRNFRRGIMVWDVMHVQTRGIGTCSCNHVLFMYVVNVICNFISHNYCDHYFMYVWLLLLSTKN